jgi:predicted NACHT family NTPase
MIEELISKYQVPRQLARTWVETDQILPLLDGLDEVAVEHRTRCIEAINTYQQEHAFLPLVVSSRSADYLAQSARVKLTSAVTIQPLTQQQVDEYLTQAGEPLWALRVALHQDAALRELAETPLMLSILTLTYHGMPVEELLRGGVAPTRQQVFERYVKQALTRRGGKTQYKPEQTMKWLTWLAQQMR